jgi:hypothetical protein
MKATRLRFDLPVAVIAAGVLLRVALYLRNPAVWHDEAALLVNVIDKTFSELLGPLEFSEAAPPLFMWLERAVVVSMGSNTFAVRLPVLLAACATVVLLVPLARRVVAAAAVPLAVAIVAFSRKLVEHSGEAKPYAIDVLCAAVLLWLFLNSRSWRAVTRILTFAALFPFLLWLSYPAAFGVGGVALALAIDERSGAGDRRRLVAAGLLVVSTLVAFAALVGGPVQAQRVGPLLQDWRGAFPDYGHPWTIPVWAIRETIGVADYDFRPLGGLLLVASCAGLRAVWRRDRALAVALAAPWGLAIVAALIHQYPYAGARVLIFTLPAFALCAAEGAHAFATEYGRGIRQSTIVVAAAAVATAIVFAARVPTLDVDCTDAAGAARFVLSRLAAGDTVDWPGWEFNYYRRAFGPPAPAPQAVPSGRVWLVVRAPSAEEREHMFENRRARTAVPIERHEFNRLSVYVLESNAPPPTTPASSLRLQAGRQSVRRRQR